MSEAKKHEPPLVVLTDKSFYPMRRAEALGCCKCPHYTICESAPLKKTPQICWDIGEALETLWEAQRKNNFALLPSLSQKTIKKLKDRLNHEHD